MMSLEEVYKQFERFLHSQASHWKSKFEYDEIFQTAVLGLMKAYKTYDESKGLLFMTYLSTVVNNEILMYNRKHERYLGQESLNRVIPGKDHSECELQELIADEKNGIEELLESFELEDNKQQLKAAMEKLSERQRNVIVDYYIKGLNQNQICEKYGLCQSYISRIIKTGLKRLKLMCKGKFEEYNTGGLEMKNMTKENLLEDVRRLGMGRKALEEMAKKYETTPGTISNYIYSRYGINLIIKAEREKEKALVEHPVENKPVEVETTPKTPVIETAKPEKVGLRPEPIVVNMLKITKMILSGEFNTYEIENNQIFFGNMSVTLKKEQIDNYIMELKQLKETMESLTA